MNNLYELEIDATPRQAQGIVKRLERQGYQNITCKRLRQDYYFIRGEKVDSLALLSQLANRGNNNRKHISLW